MASPRGSSGVARTRGAAEPGRSRGEVLERLYGRLNRREFVEPDPLQFLYAYEGLPDREVAALAASSLAYGRVAQILTSVGRLLALMGPEPALFLSDCRGSLPGCGFRHRFTPGDEMGRVLLAASAVQKAGGGTLQAAFAGAADAVEAGSRLVRAILREAGMEKSTMLPDPAAGSACKRLHLMFRWLVRRDDVDPGGWDALAPSQLSVPLDVHMHRAGLMLRMTSRGQADGRTVAEVTEGFRALRPDDPVRYDFALTRFGIRPDLTWAALEHDLRF